jgi:hypothetical protein
MNGKFHGKGVLTANGTVYDGEWADGVKSGQGTFTAKDEESVHVNPAALNITT